MPRRHTMLLKCKTTPLSTLLFITTNWDRETSKISKLLVVLKFSLLPQELLKQLSDWLLPLPSYVYLKRLKFLIAKLQLLFLTLLFSMVKMLSDLKRKALFKILFLKADMKKRMSLLPKTKMLTQLRNRLNPLFKLLLLSLKKIREKLEVQIRPLLQLNNNLKNLLLPWRKDKIRKRLKIKWRRLELMTTMMLIRSLISQLLLLFKLLTSKRN